MARYALVRTSDNTVMNIIEWDGGAGWAPPAGFSARPAVVGDAKPVEPSTAAVSTIVSQMQQSMDTLRTYAALASPTAAQTTNASQLMARTMVRMLRDRFGLTDQDT